MCWVRWNGPLFNLGCNILFLNMRLELREVWKEGWGSRKRKKRVAPQWLTSKVHFPVYRRFRYCRLCTCWSGLVSRDCVCYILVSQSCAGRTALRPQQIKGESVFSFCWLFPARGRLPIPLTLQFAFSKAITKWQQPLCPLEVTRRETYSPVLLWNEYPNCTLHGRGPHCPNSYTYNPKPQSFPSNVVSLPVFYLFMITVSQKCTT